MRSRLAVPDVASCEVTSWRREPAGWTEAASAEERIVTALAYAPDGRVEDGEITLAAEDAILGGDAWGTLDPVGTLQRIDARDERELCEALPGPSTKADFLAWRTAFAARAGEVPAATRARLTQRRRATVADGLRRETYRRLSSEEALSRLCDS